MTHLLIAIAVALSLQPAAAEVKPAKIVSFDELIRAVKAHKGKIVVVDFWNDGCGECKREFPGLIKLHKERQASGVVCISVALDDPEDKPTIERVNAFLRQQGAAFENFVLNLPGDDWEPKLGIAGVPAVFVFGRDGKLAKAFKSYRTPDNPDASVKYEKIEPYVLGLLKP